ncbi:S-phase kinase-associated protein 1-like [Bradysia coprophila]|uniref:S-phase kinase-associated protein 1-like n=1 Tax=Bradysia coprophila TaxID=38358 RepID=UPI00187D82F8|nr:S-phase kinase-associated protein 1-like [Bradysia coprophila]
MSSTIRLQSCDGQVFTIDAKVAKTAGTIKNLLEDCGIEEGSETLVPLPNVSGCILEKILEFARYHQDDAVKIDDGDKDKRKDDVSAWDAEFLKMDQATLFELILAANYLDAKALLDAACKTVANLIKGKSPDEIRRTFNITNDFTAAEMEQVRRENDWCDAD